MSIFEKLLDRREFLRTCGRNITLTGLTILGGVLLFRKPDDRAKHLCINDSICRGCRVFSDCILPSAISAKADPKVIVNHKLTIDN